MRTTARELFYKYSWVRAGQIALRRAEGQPIIVIGSSNDNEIV